MPAGHHRSTSVMNKYLWSALAFVALFAACLAALLLLDVSNTHVEDAVNVALTAVTTCTAVAGSVLAIAGKKKQKESSTRDFPESISVSDLPVVRIASAERDRESSLATYIGQMRSRLVDLGMDQRSFISLSTIADSPQDRTPGSEFMPNLEWMNKRASTELLNAEPEKIELLKIPDKFDRTVLLGEPGSGKSTCLQRLALEELERAAVWLENHRNGLTEGAEPFGLLPLYVTLSEWQPGIRALDFLRAQLQKLVGPENYYVNHFETLLADGAFILLLDGLNELPGRRPSGGEGRHEQSAEQMDTPRFPVVQVSLDRREAELREMASSIGLQSKFVLTCRSHEYFDSYRWQVVRILPMTAEQINQFIRAYLAPERAAQLIDSLQGDAKLAAIADNPFFLRTITRIYRPGLNFNSRGEILTNLYRILLESERRRAGAEIPPEPVLTAKIGAISFHMLAAGKVGSQAPLDELNETERQTVRSLAGTGLVIERGGSYFFLHQIIQEFFAAQALYVRAVRRSPKTLLADKRWSEVVALWCDLDSDHLPERVRSALRARNMPWRRPRSTPSPVLVFYQFLTSGALIVVAAAYFWNWLLGPMHTLGLPASLGLIPLLVLAIALAIRLPWSCLTPHRKVTINSAYILSVIHYPAALRDIILSLSVLYYIESAEVAGYVSQSFGSAVLPHAFWGLGYRKWRVRSGCVQILGELARSKPTDPRVLEVLLALAKAGDPQLIRSLVESLGNCRDDRIPQAMSEILSGSHMNGFALVNRMAPLTKWNSDGTIAWDENTVARFEGLVHSDRSVYIRSAALQAMGVLRIPECEERLGSIAADREESPVVRQGAVRGLGLARTPLALERLILLGEQQPDPARKWVCQALREVVDPGAMPAFVRAAASPRWEIRQVAAAALGLGGRPEALEVLAKLAGDDDYDVREAAAHGLSLIDLPEAVTILGRLARDRNGQVRKAALEELNSRYPHLASGELLALAEDPSYPERVRAIRSLGRYVQPEIEQGLRDLTGDVDGEVREAAATALRSVRLAANSASRQRAGRRAGPLGRARQRLATWLQLDGFRQMLREERLAGTSEYLVFNKVQVRIYADAELTRRYRPLFRLFVWGFNIVMVLIGFILVLVCRLSLWIPDNISWFWPYAVGIIGLAGASLLPGLRKLRRVRVLGGIVVLVRGAFWVLLGAGFAGALTYVWWIVVPVVVGTGLIMFARNMRARRRRCRNVRVALQYAGGAGHAKIA
jgi:HEAT repeat protein